MSARRRLTRPPFKLFRDTYTGNPLRITVLPAGSDVDAELAAVP
jgi:hypothetical protein